MSEATRPQQGVPYGTALLPADLTEDQLVSAPVLTSIDTLVIDALSDDEYDAFAAAIDS